MNKKLLAALLILPLGFFAADKALGLGTPGGDKGKQKSKTVQTQTPTPQATAEAPQEDTQANQQQTTDETIEPNAAPTVAYAAETASGNDDRKAMLLEEVRAMKARSEDTESDYASEYHEASLIWRYSDEMPEPISNFLNKAVLEPLKKTNIYNIDLERNFSRCPSGYNYAVLADEDNHPLNEGFMIRDQGCWDRPIAKFRYDIDARTVDVFVSEKAGRIPLKEFLQLMDEA